MLASGLLYLVQYAPRACVAQLVEQRYRKPWVVGSSPTAGSDSPYQVVYTDAMARTRTSSRIIKKERSKLVKQFWFFVILSVLLVVAFLFFVLPNFIAITNSLFGGSPVFEKEDTIPPQVPLISAPPEATQEQSLALTGYTEADSTVVILLNQEQYERVTAGADGTFEAEVLLVDGENTVSAYSIDAAENESAVSRVYTVEYDVTDPQLVLDGLEDDATITGRENQTLQIRGITDTNAKVSVNGRVSYPDDEGAFTISYYLKEGENELQIVAEDKAGNSTEQTFMITFQL